MTYRAPQLTAILVCFMLLAGCQPQRPQYLHDRGDLSFYLDEATEIAYPDVETPMLDEVIASSPPITNLETEFESFWDLTLEDAVAIALQNSKVIRGYGTPGLQGPRVAAGVDNLANGPGGAGTLYNVGIRETEPGFIGTPGQITPAGSLSTNTGLDTNQGVEAALAEFDAQLTSNIAWGRDDRPRNVTGAGEIFTPLLFRQDAVTWTTQVAKKAANGTQLFARNVSRYTKNNIPVAVQPLASVFETALELEVRQPLLRGRGAFINRMPVVISRINSDQEIANFEAVMQNMVTNVEIRYWDLHCSYRNLATAKQGRDASQQTWRYVNENFKAGKVPLQDESQARGQYYFFRSQVEQAWVDLLIAETNLRWLLGVASNDCRLIRPIEEPTKARVFFDYCQTMDEALCFRPELRQERWEVKKRELALAYSKNSLLPNLNASALYRRVGLGDQYVNYDAAVPPFPAADSGAWNDFWGRNYDEFNFSLDFGMPIGFRRELANVRNAQLKLARELARVEDMELDVEREITQAIQSMEAQYQLAQTNFNSWAAYSAELKAREERYEAGTDPINFLLDAQRSRAQGEAAYYQAICEYNKLIALIHRRKGTILAYNCIHLGEGCWPEKAYDDAYENARRRGASKHLNYGFTRPGIVGRGPIHPSIHPGNGEGYPGIQQQDQFLNIEEVPAIEQGVAPQLAPEILPDPPVTSGQPTDTSALTIPAQRPNGPQVIHPQLPPQAATRQQQGQNVDWQKFGMSQPTGESTQTRAVIRQVSHEEPSGR
ncbi:MAG: TolC family protein [Pirellulaceae bacterium]